MGGSGVGFDGSHQQGQRAGDRGGLLVRLCSPGGTAPEIQRQQVRAAQTTQELASVLCGLGGSSRARGRAGWSKST